MRWLARYRSTMLGAGGLLALAVLAGRLSGLGRELILAAKFGISAQADTAVLLLTVPDLLVNLLLSGGLSAALVPRLRALPENEAGKVFRAACLWAFLAFALLAFVFAIWPEGLFKILAPGLSYSAMQINSPALAMLALSIPLTALSGITAALLNARGRFFIAGLGTLIFNATIILVLIGFSAGNGLFVLASAILGGATIRLLSQIAILPHDARRFTGGISKLDRTFLIAFGAGIGASFLALAPAVLVRAGASLLGAGNVALFNYAQKLVELPIGILITTISTIVLTRLSGLYAARNDDAARQTLINALRFSLLLGLMILVFGEWLAEAIAAIVFLRGAIDDQNVSQIALLTRVALVGVPFVAISSLTAVALYAQLRTPEVLRATAWSIVVLLILAVPALACSAPLALMAAVVASQAALAWFLVRRTGICLWGAAALFDGRSLGAVGVGLTIAMVFVGFASFLAIEDNFTSLLLGTLGFIAAVGTSLWVARK